MSGLKMTSMDRDAVLDAVETAPAGGDFVWDGKDEDERPLTREQMQAGVAAYRKQPVGTHQPALAHLGNQPCGGAVD